MVAELFGAESKSQVYGHLHCFFNDNFYYQLVTLTIFWFTPLIVTKSYHSKVVLIPVFTPSVIVILFL